MSRVLPRKPHLDSLRKQARSLYRAHAISDPDAIARIRQFLPQLRHASDDVILRQPFPLQSAQCVLAREYGFGNWSQLTTAVDVLRQAESAMLEDVESCLSRPQPIHVLVQSHLTEEVYQRLSAEIGTDHILLVQRQSMIDNELLDAALTEALVVVGSPDSIGFPLMYERMSFPDGPRPIEGHLARSHAFLNVRKGDEKSPLVVSRPDSLGQAEDISKLDLIDLYDLYHSMSDHRY